MKTKKVYDIDRDILLNARKWANQMDCRPLVIEDIKELCKYYKMDMPTSFTRFVSSKRPHIATIKGSETVIMRTLSKLRDKILCDNY